VPAVWRNALVVRPWPAAIAVLLIVVLLGMPAASSLAKIMPLPPVRFTFDIDAKTPVKDLLPTPPKLAGTPVLCNDDPARAPEVSFGEPVSAKAENPMK